MDKGFNDICFEFIDFLIDIIIMKTNYNSKKELFYDFVCKKMCEDYKE